MGGALPGRLRRLSARIGRTTGHGLAGNLRRYYPGPILQVTVTLLLVANVINIGADLGAMADATRLLIGGNQFALVLLFGVASITMEVFLKYKRYVSVLKWLAATLLAYLIAVVLADVAWRTVFASIVRPHIIWQSSYLTTLVAIFGTTISPYLFFWQASQEAEDLHERPRQEPLVRNGDGGQQAIERIELDTMIGMGFSNLIALAILISMAAVAARSGPVAIESSAQAAEALRPSRGLTHSLCSEPASSGPACSRCPFLRVRQLMPWVRRCTGRWDSVAGRSKLVPFTAPSLSRLRLGCCSISPR